MQGASTKRLDADVLGLFYAFVARSGQQTDYDTIKNIYLSVSVLFSLAFTPLFFCIVGDFTSWFPDPSSSDLAL